MNYPTTLDEAPPLEEAKGNMRLIKLAPTASHECSDPRCPGNVNRQKLELWDEMLDLLVNLSGQWRARRDALVAKAKEIARWQMT